MNTHGKAVPTASGVTILGEPIAGGTIEGSYIYQNADENPEGTSSYRWYDGGVEGSIVATTINLTLIPEHAGMVLTFSVIPVSLSGESGEETFSAPKAVAPPSFQRITDEESEHSFMKQRGNFAFHKVGPKDRVFTSTGGAFALKSRTTQNVLVRGPDAFGGTVPPALAGYLLNNPAITMFSTINCFGALVPVGSGTQLLVWGPGTPATLPNLQDIEAVYSNASSFAFIYKNPKPGENTIDAVGTAATGGVVPIEIQNKLFFDKPKAIYSTVDAFAVLTENGKIYAWGGAANGGVIPPDVKNTLDYMTVQRVVASKTAFCAIDQDGYLAGWGANGIIPAATLDKIYSDGGAGSVIASESAFCAITRTRRTAATWGLASAGGTMSEVAASLAARGNIVLCSASPWAVCFVNASGQAAAWGSAGYGGDPIPTAASASDSALPQNAQDLLDQGDTKQQIEKLFQASPVASRSGKGRGPANSLKRVTSTVQTADGGDVELIRNDASFVLVSRDGNGRTKNVLSWGLAASGGTIPADVKQILLASHIRKVYCSNGAYAALLDQGNVEGAVLTWGRATTDGGTVPPALQSALTSGVVEIYAIQSMPAPSTAATKSAFAARKANNSYVTWGAYVTQEEFIPDQVP